MALVNKKITPDELVQRLVNSRKVMEKINTGDYEKGNINEQELIGTETEELTDGEKAIPFSTLKESASKLKTEVIDIERIKQSNLPDNIKKAMLENPIPKITLNDSLDIGLVNKAKRLMEQEGVDTPQTSKKRTTSEYSTQINENKLEKLIENAVRKVLDEKINQILSAHQLGTINENLVLKVGNSIFQGKITGVKNTKSNK
jgi:CHAT domain-containing protein